MDYNQIEIDYTLNLYPKRNLVLVKGENARVWDEQGKLLPVPIIARYVQAFIRFAETHREVKFRLTRIACGRDAHRDDQIAPLFASAPANCYLPKKWQLLLKR